MTENKTKILFLGSADFAVPSLEWLLDQSHVEVVGVVTQPDMPAGRHQELKPTPVKEFLLRRGYSGMVFTPEKLRNETSQILANTSPDLIITAAYGQIVPKEMLDFPKLGAWNLHGSILPKLRGAVPVQMAILHGFEITGVTLQQMSEGMDEGAILATSQIKLTGEETTGTLMNLLAGVGRDLLLQNLNKIIAQSYQLVEQDDSEATYCYQKDIRKEKAEITSETSAQQAERMIRAFNPWPIAWFTIPNGLHAGKRLKIFKAKFLNSNAQGVFELKKHDKNLLLCLRDGVLQIEQLQLEGKEKRTADAYTYLV